MLTGADANDGARGVTLTGMAGLTTEPAALLTLA
jgi:hypothetical protein